MSTAENALDKDNHAVARTTPGIKLVMVETRDLAAN